MMIQLPRTARSVFVCPANVSSFFFPVRQNARGKRRLFHFVGKLPLFPTFGVWPPFSEFLTLMSYLAVCPLLYLYIRRSSSSVGSSISEALSFSLSRCYLLGPFWRRKIPRRDSLRSWPSYLVHSCMASRERDTRYPLHKNRYSRVDVIVLGECFMMGH